AAVRPRQQRHAIRGGLVRGQNPQQRRRDGFLQEIPVIGLLRQRLPEAGGRRDLRGGYAPRLLAAFARDALPPLAALAGSFEQPFFAAPRFHWQYALDAQFRGLLDGPLEAVELDQRSAQGDAHGQCGRIDRLNHAEDHPIATRLRNFGQVRLPAIGNLVALARFGAQHARQMPRIVAAQLRRAAMDGVHKEPSPGQETILSLYLSRIRSTMAALLGTVAQEFPPAPRYGRPAASKDRADPVGLQHAAHLAWIRMVAVAAAVGGRYERENRQRLHCRRIPPVSDPRAVLRPVHQDAGHDTRGNIHHVVVQPPPVGESGRVAHQEAEASLLTHGRRRNAGVEPQQVRNRPRIRRRAHRTDRGHVLHQRQQIQARRRRYRDADGREDLGQQRVRHETGELRVVLRLAHAKRILRPGSDNQLVDERVAHALHLRPLWRGARLGGSLHARCDAPRTDHGCLVRGGVRFSLARQHGDGHFQNDRVDIETGQGVRREVLEVGVVDVRLQYASAGSGAEVQRVERGPQIDEERIRHRTGENTDTVRQGEDPLLTKLSIVGHGPRSHVGRYGVQGLAEGEGRADTPGHHRYGVVLPQAQAIGSRPVQSGNRRYSGQAAHESRE